MAISRRTFLTGVATASAGFLGLATCMDWRSPNNPYRNEIDLYGPLMKDRAGLLDLPEGFSYEIISRAGWTMDDGLLVPGKPDGMATFPGEDGRIILVLNHELMPEDAGVSAFGSDLALLSKLAEGELYDPGSGNNHALGGTATMLYNPGTREIEKHFLSLAGTIRNCAGGPTPWGSWLSCEETTLRRQDGWSKDHGFVFEVPATAEGGLARPVPLRDLGRFRHEAAAVDPATGMVYETEDEEDGLFYRFIPEKNGELLRGGKLQALAIRNAPGFDTRNRLTENPFAEGTTFEVEWIDLVDVHNPLNDLKMRGHEDGAALFARGEGIWFGDRELYFCCTSGGPNEYGQIWRYRPSRFEGTALEADNPARLELYLEPRDRSLLEKCDNITMAPWGDLLVCEDRIGADYLRGVRPDGAIYTLARYPALMSELAGVCFSEDGTILFLNLYGDGLTLAIRGPFVRTP